MNEEFDESNEIQGIECDQDECENFKEKISRHDLYDFYGLSRSDFM
jgi:hypothetical protein